MDNQPTHSIVREEWKKFLASIEPDYLVTITFSRGLPDKSATATLQFFLRGIFKAFPRRIRDRCVGAVSVERTNRGRYAGTYHFHILFCRVDDCHRDYELKFKGIAAKTAARLKDGQSRSLVPPKNLHIVSVWDPVGLADYVTKMGKFPFDRDGLKIWMFDRTGVDHDLPDDTDMIWVSTNFRTANALDRRRGATYSRIPRQSWACGKSRSTTSEIRHTSQ
jgi:hypothetical protein